MDYASYHNEIDDGTDDNEVVDLQMKQHGALNHLYWVRKERVCNITL